MTASANGIPESAPVFTPPSPAAVAAPMAAPVAPVTAPAPHSAAAQVTEEDAREARLREVARILRDAPRVIPVTDVAVIIGMTTREGKREEIIYDIGLSTRICECTYTNKEKIRAVSQDGQHLGYEPSGEYELVLKVKYFKE